MTSSDRQTVIAAWPARVARLGAAGVWFLALLVTVQNVWAAGSPKCTQSDVSFDGTAPLRYTPVAGAPGARAYLYAQFPAQCTRADDQSCKDAPYVLSGDVVAVAKTCGNWAYVQYIGRTHITVGWMLASRLPPEEGSATAAPS